MGIERAGTERSCLCDVRCDLLIHALVIMFLLSFQSVVNLNMGLGAQVVVEAHDLYPYMQSQIGQVFPPQSLKIWNLAKAEARTGVPSNAGRSTPRSPLSARVAGFRSEKIPRYDFS